MLLYLFLQIVYKTTSVHLNEYTDHFIVLSRVEHSTLFPDYFTNLLTELQLLAGVCHIDQVQGKRLVVIQFVSFFLAEK